jgi:hypothetical protein
LCFSRLSPSSVVPSSGSGQPAAAAKLPLIRSV